MSAAWLAVDWGSTNVRLWALDRDGEVMARRALSRGSDRLTPADYEPVLLTLAGKLLPEAGRVPAVLCGMAGARQGGREAPYRAVPCNPAGGETVSVPTRDPRLDVRIVPGLCRSEPPDVMRGEETQIAGLLALEPVVAGSACLPGTHAKWARVSGGQVVGIATALIGELFALLSSRSVLRHSLGEGWDEAAFAEGVSRSLGAPEALVAALFEPRARSLIDGLSGDAARAFLSGLLIGAELTAMRRFWEEGQVTIIGQTALAGRYETALAAQGVAARRVEVEAVTLAGLRAHHARLWGDGT